MHPPLLRNLLILRNSLTLHPHLHPRTPSATLLSAANRLFSTTVSNRSGKNLPPRPKPPPESEIEESFLRGSGPGGQKINKTSSAVQLKHLPTGIVVKSQATRSRSQNRNHARRLLAQKLDDFLHGEQSRASIVGQVVKKKSDSAAKKSRRKYKKLAEEKAAAAGEQEQEQEQEEEKAVEPSYSQVSIDSETPDKAADESSSTKKT